MVSIIGKEIDNYRILEMIGQRRMGVVYKALHVPLKRPVAIKMIHPLLTSDQPLNVKRAMKRILKTIVLEIARLFGCLKTHKKW